MASVVAQLQAACEAAGVAVDEVQAEYVEGLLDQAGAEADSGDLADSLACVLDGMEGLTPPEQVRLVDELRAVAAEGEGDGGAEGVAEEAEVDPEVEALCGLFPDLPERDVAEALRAAGGDANEAANELAEAARHRRKENEKNEEKQAEEVERDPYYDSEEYKRLRSEVRDRYGFVDEGAARRTHRPTVRLPTMKEKQKRYINGVVVSTKGEKTITIKDEKEEAILRDTVCRGLKIVTKRKGGKGFRMT